MKSKAHSSFLYRSATGKYCKQQHVLNIMQMTMVSSKILVKGGVFNDVSNAHKVLKKLREADRIRFYKYPIPELNSFQYFYYLHSSKEAYHIIHKETLLHDSITAIFLLHLYRACCKRNITIKWYRPFPIGSNKYCDGGITLSKGQKLLRSILLETDTGTHSHSEIVEKYQSYLHFLQHPHRKILFLVPSDTRIKNLKETLFPTQKAQVYFLNPMAIEPDMDIFEYVSATPKHH